MARLKTRPLAPRTAHEYDRVLVNAFGTAAIAEAPFLATLEVGGDVPWRDGVDLMRWSDSERHLLVVAIRDRWARMGRAEVGEWLSAIIPRVYKIQRLKRHPSAVEADRFEHEVLKPWVKKPYRLLLSILIRLGLRAEELLLLHRTQVEHAIETGNLIFVRKGGRERSLPAQHLRREFQSLLGLKAHIASKDLTAALRAALGPGPLVPVNGPRTQIGIVVRDWETVREILAIGKPATAYSLLYRKVKQIARAAGLDPALWSPHSLRHAFATRMHADGAPIMVIKEALGHAFVTTTQLYVNVEQADIANYMRRSPAIRPDELPPGAPPGRALPPPR